MKCTTCRCGNVFFGDVCNHEPNLKSNWAPTSYYASPAPENKPAVPADSNLMGTLKQLRLMHLENRITQAEYDELRVKALATF